MRIVKSLGFAAALFCLAGCGGGGSSASTSSGGGNFPNPQPTTPPNDLTPVNLNFSIANFGAAQVATLVARNAPSSETGSTATAAVVSRNRSDTPVQGVQSRVAETPEEPAPERDMPVEIRLSEELQIEQIRQRTDLEIEPPIQPRFQELNKGDQTVFFITTSGQSVTCRKMNAEVDSAHCTIFAEVVGGNPVISEGVALAIIDAFDNENPFLPGAGIYDQVRAIYGSEWSTGGGRDGDAKINLVFLSASAIGGNQFFGFFRPADEFSKAQFSTSNEGEILYLNANRTTGDFFDILSTIAHEFQHCVSMNTKQIRQGTFAGTSENSAIDEGRSTLCEDLLGYGLAPAVGGQGNNFLFRSCRSFLQNPSRQGIFQFDGNLDGYGRDYTVMRYLFDRFGQTQYRNYVQSTGVGLAQLNASYPGFSSIFGEWALANLSTSLSGPVPNTLRFGPSYDPTGTYDIRELGITSLPGWTPRQVASPPSGSQSASLPAWSAASIEYVNGDGDTLNINLQGPGGLGGSVLVQSPRGTFNGLR